MNLIDLKFIGIGAPKSGTTWVAQCLNEHPDIELAKHKDTNYFLSDEFIESNYDRAKIHKCLTPEDLAKEFSTDKSIKGEFSVNYLLDKSTPLKIKTSYPEAKIIVCIRNPIDALYSAFNYFRQLWLYKDKEMYKASSFRESIEKREVKKEFFLYHENLKRYLEIFGEENILVILYDDIKDNPREVIKNIYKFIGVDDTYIPHSVEKKVNITSVPKVAFVEKLGRNTAKLMKQMGLENLVVKLYYPYAKLNKNELQKAPIDNDLKLQLIDYYLDDIDKTGKLIGRDLSKWKNA